MTIKSNNEKLGQGVGFERIRRITIAKAINGASIPFMILPIPFRMRWRG